MIELPFKKLSHVTQVTVEINGYFVFDNNDNNLITECREFTYGKGCINLCGHCFDGEVCDHVNGTCANGCETGWTTDICNKSKDMYH